MMICRKLGRRPLLNLRTNVVFCLSIGMTLAGCGGGGGGGGSGDPATAQSCRPSVISGYGPVATSGYVDGSGDASGAGSGRGGAGQGAGAGGGLGVYSNALITVQRADGTQVGSALTDSYGMVTVSNCGDTQPLLFTVQGTQTGTYWDESLTTPVPFGPSQVLHAVVVPDASNQQTLYRNVGITPLTEAVYQYLLINGSAGASSWKVVSDVTAANAAIASQINQVLPPSLQLQGTDIPRLAAVARDPTSQVFSAGTSNSIYGLVIGGMAQVAVVHNAQSKNPGLDLLDQLAADLSDGDLDGAKNGTPVAPSPTQAAYNVPTMAANTLGGIAALAATNGRAVPAVTYRSYNLGGSISGLTAGVLELADGPSTVVVSAPATSFAFGGVLTGGAPYAIRVQTQPSGLTCSLLNATGNAATADVTNVAVTCSAQAYTVGGTISGLSQAGLVLANGADTINVPAGATTFIFAQKVASGGGYAVTVQSQPTGENCTVANGSGTMGAGNVTNVAVTCVASDYTLSGTISGLTASGLVLANGSATVSPAANASNFTFGAVLTAGSNYAVTVQTQPAGLTCSVSNGSGTAGAANVTNVAVTCSSLSYTLGGTISNLTASGLVLSNNGTDTLSVPANATSFQFNQPVAYTSRYAVGVATQPTGMTCSVANGTGTMPAANVTNVNVTCSASAQAYTVGGMISGLTQDGLVLANGGDQLTVSANATSFQMHQSVVSGSGYDVTVHTQPTGETCTVANGSGTMGAGNVTNVAVTCTLQGYTLGGSIGGLNANGLVLSNGTDTVSVQANATSFTFGKKVAYTSAYAVAVQTQPSGENCTVSNGAGTMPAANVSNVAVTCAGLASYTVGGTVSGLTQSGLVLANGTDTLTVGANATTFMMPTPVVAGSLYAVTVQTQPTGEVCSVINGTNTMPATNVTNVQVSCSAQTYTLGGTINGLNAGGLLVVSNLVLANGNDLLTVPFGHNTFTFDKQVAFGSSYDVVVYSQPSLLGLLQVTCSVVSNGSGVMGAGPVPVTNVVVQCL
jgi:hypothetical protein